MIKHKQRWDFFISFYADLFNLRFFDLTLTSGCLLLFSLILLFLYVSQHGSLTAIGQKKASSLVFSKDTRNRDREKSSDQAYMFNTEQQEPTEPQTNHRSSRAYCTVFLWKVDHRMLKPSFHSLSIAFSYVERSILPHYLMGRWGPNSFSLFSLCLIPWMIFFSQNIYIKYNMDLLWKSHLQPQISLGFPLDCIHFPDDYSLSESCSSISFLSS